MALIGPFLVAAGLLVLAGLAKAARPDDTARALSALGGTRLARLPARGLRRAVRAGAVAEAGLGLWALLLPRPLPAALVACSYLAFALVVAGARRWDSPLASCGCFGRPDTPPTRVHLLIDVALAGSAVAVAVTAAPRGTLAGAVAHQPWGGVPLLAVSAVGTWLALLALSSLADLEGARRLFGSGRRRSAATA